MGSGSTDISVYKTSLVEIGGAPSSGKSTLTAALYGSLSEQGYSVQMVREYATEHNARYGGIGPFEHVSILGKQISRIVPFLGKVDYLISDSPLYLNSFYCSMVDEFNLTEGVVKELYKQILAGRTKIIELSLLPRKLEQAVGRIHTENNKLHENLEAYYNAEFRSLLFGRKTIEAGCLSNMIADVLEIILP